MTTIDKFSYALKKGFNSLGQPSEIFQNSDGKLHASVCYFNFEKTAGNTVKIGSHGFKIVREEDLVASREAYTKNNANPAYIEILRQAEVAFKMVREDGISLDEANEILRGKTEDFFQTYIAGEKIEQTYNPTFRQFIPERPENPDDEFNYRRTLQRIDEQIGTVCEIPHDQIRMTWGLD